MDAEKIAEEPRIKSWREAYRAVRGQAGRTPLLRGSHGPAGPARRPAASISALVDLGNVMSLRASTPAGAHAIDLLNGSIELRFATGDEEFVAFSSEELEHPLPGEVIFVENGKTVLTRRWTWRQGNHTLTLPETTAIEFNVDGLPPITHDEVEAACAEVAELIGRFCGGTNRIAYLMAENPRISLAP